MRILLSFCSLVLLSAPLAAQGDLRVTTLAAPSASACRRTVGNCVPKSLTALRLTQGESIDVDGNLTEAVWTRAVFVRDFVQREPHEGQPATSLTEVAFAADGDALYVAARLRDTPADRRAVLTRRDSDGNSDRFLVSLDAYGDRRTAYTFGVTAAGVRLDWYHATDSEGARDRSYDPIWIARTQRDGDGWTVEMKIPFSQLRFTPGADQAWGVNVQRYVASRNEDVFWSGVPRNETGWASWFGDLSGLGAISARRPVELMPYVTGSAERTSPSLVVPGNPYQDGERAQGRAGVDVKAGLGSNLTLDATVNPDFGQVEADPAVVNLTAFPIFFPERRTFFTEGSRLFQRIGPDYFYSRRIGAPPRGPASGDFVDRPANSTILGAAKLTGRLPSGLSIGALAAVTQAEDARTFHLAEQTERRTRIEPLAGYGVMRLQQELGRSRSTLGMILTGTERDLEAGATLSHLMARRAWSGGADWNLRFGRGRYELAGYAGLSHVAGDSLAIQRLQRSSARYFQRPDATHVKYESGRTSLTGWTGGLDLRKTGGTHWIGNAGVRIESPGLELNDLGRMRDADNIATTTQLTYRENTPKGFLRNYWFTAGFDGLWNFAGERQSASAINLEAHASPGWWHTMIILNYNPAAQDDALTRGGPSMATPSNAAWNWFFFTDSRKRTQWSHHLQFAHDGIGGRQAFLNGTFSAQPSDAFTLSAAPGITRRWNSRQYVSTLAGGRAETFGRRYVFGTIAQTTVSLALRANYALTPDLSLEAWGQPFVSTGRYTDFGELEAPAGLRLRTYGEDGTTIERAPGDGPPRMRVTDGASTFTFPKSDFEVLSFRTNLVLRWEWRPGSTLFLVWQQDQGESDPTADPRSARPDRLFDAISTRGRSVLAVKASYWFPW